MDNTAVWFFLIIGLRSGSNQTKYRRHFTSTKCTRVFWDTKWKESSIYTDKQCNNPTGAHMSHKAPGQSWDSKAPIPDELVQAVFPMRANILTWSEVKELMKTPERDMVR